MRHLVGPLVFLMAGLMSFNALWAQATPKKIIFVGAVGGPPPPATSSTMFGVPAGVAIGLSTAPGTLAGTIYVADPNNNQVVAFPPAGGPVTFRVLPCPNGVRGCFGNSTWTLNSPTFVATASTGNIWISDTGNDVVVQITPTGTVVQFAGTGPSGVVQGCFLGIGCSANPNSGQANGQFFGPGPLAVDGSDNLYVADAAGDLALNRDGPAVSNVRIEKFDKNGNFLTSWGSFCVLDDTGAQLAGTQGMCNRTAPGAAALGDGQLAWVGGIGVDNNSNVYLSDAENNRVQKFTANGRFLLKWGGRPKRFADGQFTSPGGIAVDLDQTIYVTDIGNHRIQEFTTGGAFVDKTGSIGSGEAQFNRPFGIASVPPAAAFACLFTANPSDCVHGLVVSELGPPNNRVQFMAGRADSDMDGIADEIDLQPQAASTAFSNAALGFTTFGTIVSPGDQVFAIYNVLSPTAVNQINVRAESTGGPRPLTVSLCNTASIDISAGGGTNLHCSTPTVSAESGPIAFQFTGSDGTVAKGILQTGDGASFDPHSSMIQDNAGIFSVSVGNTMIPLTPSQTAFADATAPTSAAVNIVNLTGHGWFRTNIAVTLNATDNQAGSGVKTITYNLSGAQPGAGTVPGNTTTVPIMAEGVTELSFSATDNAGNKETPKTVTMRIDKTPPRMLCKAKPAFLKPTERMIEVTLSVAVDDALSGPAGFVLSSVTSNRPHKSERDIQGFKPGTASVSGSLRALRERVYTFVYAGTDQAGNQDSCSVQVPVGHPHEYED